MLAARMPPPERRLPSVINVPAVRGNAAAQELDARLTAGETPLGRLGVVAFWTPARRDIIMQLPTSSGEAVLQAFGKVNLTTIREEQREACLHAMLHALLHDLVDARWRIDCQRVWLAVALRALPGVVAHPAACRSLGLVPGDLREAGQAG